MNSIENWLGEVTQLNGCWVGSKDVHFMTERRKDRNKERFLVVYSCETRMDGMIVA